MSEAFEQLFASGHAADLILAVLAVEAIILARRGWSIGALAGFLGPAFLIVLGLRAALVGAAWPLIALPLALALPLHLYDLKKRAARD